MLLTILLFQLLLSGSVFFFFIKVFLEESAFPKYMLVFFKLFLKFCLTFDFSSKTFFYFRSDLKSTIKWIIIHLTVVIIFIVKINAKSIYLSFQIL